jgi:hypothetical protein
MSEMISEKDAAQLKAGVMLPLSTTHLCRPDSSGISSTSPVFRRR